MPTPTLKQRLELRDPPPGRAVMSQRWAELLFLHWRVDAERLRPRLPAGLHPDLHDGEAWLGIVPFRMQRIRPRGLLPLPWLSWFLELNVRTYVHDDAGTPGVWFFSLDCNQPLAVEFARRAFHLNYCHAAMSSRRDQGLIDYRCRRRGEDADARFRYTADGGAREAEPGSLEFFLAERYLLYSSDPAGRIHQGRVHHAPYRLRPGRCESWSILPASWDGIELGDREPDSVLWADPVGVRVFPLKPSG